MLAEPHPSAAVRADIKIALLQGLAGLRDDGGPAALARSEVPRLLRQESSDVVVTALVRRGKGLRGQRRGQRPRRSSCPARRGTTADIATTIAHVLDNNVQIPPRAGCSARVEDGWVIARRAASKHEYQRREVERMVRSPAWSA